MIKKQDGDRESVKGLTNYASAELPTALTSLKTTWRCQEN